MLRDAFAGGDGEDDDAEDRDDNEAFLSFFFFSTLLDLSLTSDLLCLTLVGIREVASFCLLLLPFVCGEGE